jgi:hypothetical protein
MLKIVATVANALNILQRLQSSAPVRDATDDVPRRSFKDGYKSPNLKMHTVNTKNNTLSKRHCV